MHRMCLRVGVRDVIKIMLPKTKTKTKTTSVKSKDQDHDL